MSNHKGGPLCVAILAFAVSLVSLGLSVWTALEQVDFNAKQITHNHLSLTPILSFERDLVPDSSRDFIGLYLCNAGEGVAKDFTMTVRVRDLEELGVSTSQPEQQDPMLGLRELLKEMYPESPTMVTRNGVPGAMQARAEALLLGIREEDYDAEWVSAFGRLMSHVEIAITYRSLYDDNFEQQFRFAPLQ